MEQLAESVSLYSLQRESGRHRDTLEILCRRMGIPITYAAVSTPRYRVRRIAHADVGKLLRAAGGGRNAEGPCPRAISGRRRVIMSGSTIAAAG